MREVATGETLRARWASVASHASRSGVLDELFVLAAGPSAELALDAIEALAEMADPASRSGLPSPPADPLAALLHLAGQRLLERGAGPVALAALRLTSPWAAVALAGDVYFTHVGAAPTPSVTRAIAPPLGAPGPLALRYVPVARGDRLVLATAETDADIAADRALSIEERARGLAAGDDEAAIVIELI